MIQGFDANVPVLKFIGLRPDPIETLDDLGSEWGARGLDEDEADGSVLPFEHHFVTQLEQLLCKPVSECVWARL